MENKRISDSLIDPETQSTIQGTTAITGNITGPGDLVLAGMLNGDVTIGGLLLIGEKGSVQGKVTAQNLILAGRVSGRITVTERIEIRTSGRIEGNITCQKIAIAEGAYLDGEVHTHKGKTLAPDFFAEKRKDLHSFKAADEGNHKGFR